MSKHDKQSATAVHNLWGSPLSFIRKCRLLLFSFLAATIFLGICSKSSPLYPLNDWMDVQCFLTMGRGILNGLVPYVDLYEQKGPVLYFVYAIVALLSQKNMLGQYLLEVITFGLFLYYSAKIARIYLDDSKFLYLIIIGLAATVTVSKAFAHGGSVEQASLFMFAYGLYSVLQACHENRPLSFREALVNGIFAGIVLWVKYTMLGFYLGLCLFVLIWYLIWIREVKKLLAAVGQFLLGIGSVTAVVLLYFLIVGGLDELFTCYFYNNIFLYFEEGNTSPASKIANLFYGAMMSDMVIFVLLVIGLLWLILRMGKAPRDLLAILLSFPAMVIGTSMGMGYAYYALVFSAFAVFGLIAVAALLRKLRLTALFEWLVCHHSWVYVVPILAFFIFTAFTVYDASDNTYLMHYDKEDLPQYQFAEIIQQTEDAKLLNLGFLDGGFYYAADVIPNCRFFCTFNVRETQMWDTQHYYIDKGMFDYIVTRRPRDELEEKSPEHCTYRLIKTANCYYEGYMFTYYLYQLVR